MMKYKNSLIAFFLVSTCATLSTGPASASPATIGASVNQADTVTVKSDSNSSPNDMIEIMPEDFKPAFTRDTVIKLNSIVHQSYAIIGQFDEFRKGLSVSLTESGTQKHPSKTLGQEQYALIGSLNARSKIALADMDKAVIELKASNEHYNTAVLAGMVIFVKNVEQEVSGFYQSSLRSKS